MLRLENTQPLPGRLGQQGHSASQGHTGYKCRSGDRSIFQITALCIIKITYWVEISLLSVFSATIFSA